MANVLDVIDTSGKVLLLAMSAWKKYIDEKDEKRINEILEINRDEKTKMPKNRDNAMLDALDYELMQLQRKFLQITETARSDFSVPKRNAREIDLSV